MIVKSRAKNRAVANTGGCLRSGPWVTRVEMKMLTFCAFNFVMLRCSGGVPATLTSFGITATTSGAMFGAQFRRDRDISGIGAESGTSGFLMQNICIVMRDNGLVVGVSCGY